MKTIDLRLAVYQPDIPQNLGSMLRLTACFGIQMDIIGPCGFPFSKSVLKRTAMDYLDLTEIEHHSSYEFFRANLLCSRRLVLLTAQSSVSIWDFNFQTNDTIIVGRESAGVPDVIRKEIKDQIKIPMMPSARCLNVANAASIALAEASRQMRNL
ncbi:MAG: TrmH family RNA methyltransferase [Pseudomonadota bacterium]|nr:TrmH family RNA methyltransferase [Pseudomonadota bacterium]|tara:strand:+ start:91 stop:555 length:465 start_codon:yes stop_codon:yes gene_type:complete